METEVIRKRFTADEYRRMGKAGIFGPEDRTELIDGEIIHMNPIGRRHAARVNRATAVLLKALGDRAVVSGQNPVQLSHWTEPQPDIAVLKPRTDFYEEKRPTPEDVLLLMEVSDTTMPYDLKVKLPHYAAAGIPEVWVQDVNADVLHVFREPVGKAYAASMRLKRGDSISPLAFPDIQFSLDDFLGAAA